jgi:type VI secretion system secreted protein Hcp
MGSTGAVRRHQSAKAGDGVMAQRDMYLELDGIKGESGDEKFKDSLEIYSYSIGVSNQGTGGGQGGSGGAKAVFSDLHCTKIADTATTTLWQFCANGTHIKNGKLHIRKAGGTQQEYQTYLLTEVFITNWSQSGSDGGGIPTESFSLNYSKLEIDYKLQKPDGSLGPSTKKGWDLKANVKI